MIPGWPSSDSPAPRTRVSQVLVAACAGAVSACGLWALWPLPSPEIVPPVIYAAPAPVTRVAAAALDLDAFSAPIWVAEPPPPAPPVAAPPPPPLKHQLLAITSEGGVLRAVLYDPESDRLHVVAPGEPIGRGRVEEVRSGAVVIRDGTGMRTLALNDGGKQR